MLPVLCLQSMVFMHNQKLRDESGDVKASHLLLLSSSFFFIFFHLDLLAGGGIRVSPTGFFHGEHGKNSLRPICQPLSWSFRLFIYF